MASEAGIRAGAAYIEMYVKDSALAVGIATAEKKLKALGASISYFGNQFFRFGVMATAPLLAASRQLGNYGMDMLNAAERTGIAVEELQRLRFAALATGGDAESLEMALKKMSRFTFEAAMGSKVHADMLQLLGINLQALQKLDPATQFRLYGQALHEIKNPIERASIALTIFGKSGTGILPIFKNGSAGVDEFGKKCDALGITIRERLIIQAEAFGIKMVSLWEQTKTAAFIMGNALLPVLDKVAYVTGVNILKFEQFVDTHHGLVVAGGLLVGGVLATGISLMILGPIVSSVGRVFGLLGFGITALVTGPMALLRGGLRLVGVGFSAFRAAAGTFLAFRASITAIGIGVVAIWRGMFIVVASMKAAWAAAKGFVATMRLLHFFMGSAAFAGFALQSVFSLIGTGLSSVLSMAVSLVPTLLAIAPFLVIGYGIYKLFLNLRAVGSSMLSDLSRGFQGLLSAASDTIAGVIEALNSGDLTGAAEIAFAGLTVVWAQTVTTFREIWRTFVEEFKATLSSLYEDMNDFLGKVSVNLLPFGAGALAPSQLGDQEIPRAVSLPYGQQENVQDRQDNDPAIIAARERLERARNELDAQLEDQRFLRGIGGPGAPPGRGPSAIPDLQDVMDLHNKKVDVQGTFNSAVAGRLGATSVNDRIAGNTGRIVTNTQRIIQEIQKKQGAAFV